MPLSTALKSRCDGVCELCNNEPATIAYTVSPKSEEDISNQVALCVTCSQAIDNLSASKHWRCLEGSIWHPEPSVQALSYRLLHQLKSASWAEQILDSVFPDEDIIEWAMSGNTQADVHKDAFGNELMNGDNVVLTQSLNVKGTNFSAPKGTIVKKIRLVHDNVEQIEGKINEQTIVILTKYVKKG
jgi:protein PhnA